jgi:hypothetical protein
MIKTSTVLFGILFLAATAIALRHSSIAVVAVFVAFLGLKFFVLDADWFRIKREAVANWFPAHMIEENWRCPHCREYFFSDDTTDGISQPIPDAEAAKRYL